MQSINILGVKVDKVNMDQALELVEQWIKAGGEHQIVTTNIEFIMSAQSDPEFKKILNGADLSIPDSARFGWVQTMISGNFLTKLLIWPFFLFPKLAFLKDFPVVTGTDLVEEICKKASKNGWKVGFIGGKKGVGRKAADKLEQKYPGLKAKFADDGGEIGLDGLPMDPVTSNQLPATDILFVAFGHIKQEKWIKNYMDKVNSKVFIGVGGALDYISGSIPRAPELVRNLGLEWLFRLFVQPWRIKRFLNLLRFIFKIW